MRVDKEVSFGDEEKKIRAWIGDILENHQMSFRIQLSGSERNGMNRNMQVLGMKSPD